MDLLTWEKQFLSFEREVYIQSKRADAEGGVAVRESKSGADLGELAAAEEAVTVSQLSVVFKGSLLRSSGGGVGPLLDRLRVAVVHGEGVDLAMAAPPNGEEEEENDGDCAESEHFLGPNGRKI